MTELAVDISNYTTPRPLSTGDVQCWMANGVTRAIVQAVQGGGSYPIGQTPQQLSTCAVAGVRTDSYILPFNGDSVQNLRAKRSLTSGYRIGQWWFDLEEPMSLDYVRFVLAEMDTWPADEGPTGIYTAYWYMSNQGWLNVTEFSNRRLWLMQRSTDRGLPFSGWTEWAMRQYALDATLCGIRGIDISEINPAYSNPLPTGGDDMIIVAEGMRNQMNAAGDAPLAYHKFEDLTDDEGKPYKVESCLGSKGWYYSSNSNGPDQWVNAGPL